MEVGTACWHSCPGLFQSLSRRVSTCLSPCPGVSQPVPISVPVCLSRTSFLSRFISASVSKLWLLCARPAEKKNIDLWYQLAPISPNWKVVRSARCKKYRPIDVRFSVRVSQVLTVPALVKRATLCCCIQRHCAGSGLRRVGVLFVVCWW